MKSLIFEKKYGVKIEDVKTIKDIEDIVENKSGKKVRFSQSGNLLMVRGGHVFDIVEYKDPSIKIDKHLNNIP